MGVYALKPRFRSLLRPVASRIAGAGVSADAVTWAGLGFAVMAGVGVWLGRHGDAWLVLVPAGAFLRTAANALDGVVAEMAGAARPAGEVLNETLDRVADVTVFLPVALVPGVPRLLVAGALASMLTSSFLGIAVKAAGGPRVYSGVMGKPDRMAVIGVAAIAALWVGPARAFTWGLWVVLAGCVVTILQRAARARRELR